MEYSLNISHLFFFWSHHTFKNAHLLQKLKSTLDTCFVCQHLWRLLLFLFDGLIDNFTNRFFRLVFQVIRSPINMQAKENPPLFFFFEFYFIVFEGFFLFSYTHL